MGQLFAAAIPFIFIEIVKAFQRTPPPDQPVPQVQKLTKDEKAELIERAKATLGMNPNVFNFGVTGQSRTGKSSLVNAIRMIPDNDPNAAVVGETECTMKSTAFPHPEIPHFVVWDIPGAGTATHPIATYFNDKCLMAYDALIVNCESAFTENDLYIAKEAVNAGIAVIAVRQKANLGVDARMRRAPRGTSIDEVKRELIREIKQNISANLATQGLNIPIYVVNAWACTDQNSPAFEEAALMNELHRLAYRRISSAGK